MSKEPNMTTDEAGAFVGKPTPALVELRNEDGEPMVAFTEEQKTALQKKIERNPPVYGAYKKKTLSEVFLSAMESSSAHDSLTQMCKTPQKLPNSIGHTLRKQQPHRAPPEPTAEEKQQRINEALIRRGRAMVQQETQEKLIPVQGNLVAQYFLLVQRAVWIRNQLIAIATGGRQTGKASVQTQHVTIIAPVLTAECTRIVEMLPPHFQRMLMVNAADMNPAV